MKPCECLLTLVALSLFGCGQSGGGPDLGTAGDLAMAGADLAGKAGDLLAMSGDLASATGDLSSQDLAHSMGDLAAPPPFDLAASDLAGDSGVGEPCGGFVQSPKHCLPGLVCQPAHIPDLPGTCAYPDAGMCHANGGSCLANADCCSDNCILRGNPGFCCQPGGCP